MLHNFKAENIKIIAYFQEKFRLKNHINIKKPTLRKYLNINFFSQNLEKKLVNLKTSNTVIEPFFVDFLCFIILFVG